MQAGPRWRAASRHAGDNSIESLPLPGQSLVGAREVERNKVLRRFLLSSGRRSQTVLLSGYGSTFQADYKCQRESDDMQLPMMHVFTRKDGKIFHFWATELEGNHVDTVWPYWNLLDFTPEGRPEFLTPPQNFRSEFLEKHYLNKA